MACFVLLCSKWSDVMQVLEQIDSLISKLNNFKPQLSSDLIENEAKFEDILTSSLEAISNNSSTKSLNKNAIPSWVDPEYGYDPDNQRKPNMREMMNALSGETVEDLYKDPKSQWKDISSNASEVLYGVVGNCLDTRNWSNIMKSDSILEAAREETAKMIQPTVGIASEYNEENILTNQFAVIQNKSGEILRQIPNDISKAQKVLENFGVKENAIPEDLATKISHKDFDYKIIDFLNKYKNEKNTATSENVNEFVEITTAKVIADRVANAIPEEELMKL